MGRTSIYLSIEGVNTDYRITYDSRKALDVVKESFVKQRNELKDIFNHEFGWFKKDSAVLKRNANKKSNMLIDWEETVPSNELEKTEKDSKESNKKKNNEEKVKVEWE